MAAYWCGRRFLFLSRSYLENCHTRRSYMNGEKWFVKDVLLSKPIGSEIVVKGWVQAVRRQKENSFIDVSDGSCIEKLQLVVESSKTPKELSFGSSVEVMGELVISSHSSQTVELKPRIINVVGQCDNEEYPFAARKKHPYDYMRNYLHLRPRTRTFGAILRARNAAFVAVHEFFQKHNFIFVSPPVITSNDCEGGGEVFTIQPYSEKRLEGNKNPFFSNDAFLSVSSQLHIEALACGLSNVYALGPVFRAENSRSRYHLAEFYMLEAEVAFVSSLEDILKLIESVLKWVTNEIMNKSFGDVEYLLKHGGCNTLFNVESFIQKDFIRITYDEALNILEKRDCSPKPKWGQSLAKIHEQQIVKHCNNSPVFVTNFPAASKPFYMKRSDLHPDTVEGMDLLVPGIGEICGGSLREDNFDTLKNRLEDLNLIQSLQWYLELRKFGNCPHGGFGIGFDRYLQWVLGINNIKDTLPFPCYPHHCPF